MPPDPADASAADMLAPSRAADHTIGRALPGGGIEDSAKVLNQQLKATMAKVQAAIPKNTEAMRAPQPVVIGPGSVAPGQTTTQPSFGVSRAAARRK